MQSFKNAALSFFAPSEARDSGSHGPSYWLLCCCALIAGSAILSTLAPVLQIDSNSLTWHADSWWRWPWTPWSCALVGLSKVHVWSNMLALLALAVLGQAIGAKAQDALALICAWPLTTLGLLLWPQVQWYQGLSGLIHAAVAIVVWRTIFVRDTRWLGAVLALGLVIKLCLEHAWLTPVGFNFSWGFNVVYAAHLSGVVNALILSAFIELASGVLVWATRPKP